ncbi:hypothetical protein B0H17DRAFT_1144995 [Mycena rosella]|uniref:Uncharacterized protein n=1 Tax=Mycena rosella TaxID=1033263 RepID=A0AAD7CS92_MYCRO|nr:hypothetical protein B0H17DRAFT_1144995 [Mycena rosella]
MLLPTSLAVLRPHNPSSKTGYISILGHTRVPAATTSHPRDDWNAGRRFTNKESKPAVATPSRIWTRANQRSSFVLVNLQRSPLPHLSMAFIKTTAADRACRQASRAGSAPMDTLTDRIPGDNAAESESAPMNVRHAVNLESTLTIWQAPSARGAVAAPAPSPSVAPAAETAPAATDTPAPVTTAAPAAAPAPANVTTPATASTTAETPTALVPAPLVSDIITPTTIAALAPEAAGTTLATAANTIVIQETHLDVIDVNQIASPRPEPIRRDDFPPLPSPGNKTMAPVSHTEKRKGKGKAKANDKDDNGRAIPIPGADRPDYGTVDGNPRHGSYMPTPLHGHRMIMGMMLRTLFRNHPVQQRRQWDAAPHPKLLGWISDGNRNCLQMAPHLQKHIADRFNMDPTDVRVGAPVPGEGPGPDPIAWIISIPQEQADYLLDISAFNSDNGLLTFYVPYKNPISPFLCTFTCFTIPEADAALALAIIGGAIADDLAVARFVRGHRDAFPAHLTADESFARFTESVYVLAFPLRQSDAHSPMHNEEAFILLQSLLGNLSIFTVWSGTGVVLRRFLYCHLCRSVDHSTNICPAANLPGFMGPTAETIGALKQASHNVLMQGRPGEKNQGGNNKGAKGAKGKGKNREDRKGRNGRK